MIKMEFQIQLPTLLFFQNGNGWKGSSGLLRFHVEPAEEREEGRMLPVCVWCGPFCRELSQIDDTASFPLSEEGLTQLTAWLEDWSRRDERAPHPYPGGDAGIQHSKKKRAKIRHKKPAAVAAGFLSGGAV